MISRTFSTAFEVSSIISSRVDRGFFRFRLVSRRLLLLIVTDRRLDRVFSKNRAMNLDRREVQLLYDRGILDRQRIIHRASFEPFGCEARACDGRAAAE